MEYHEDDRLSVRQKEFIAFIKWFEEINGKPPTFKEMAIGLGISSKGSVSAMVDQLTQMGYLDREHGEARGLRVRNPVQTRK